MKASDHKYLDPNPESQIIYSYTEYEGDIPFEMKSFLDNKFTQDFGFKLNFKT